MIHSFFLNCERSLDHANRIFLSPPLSIGASMINEMFFLHEKGEKLGIWTLMTTLGPPVGT